MISALRPGEAVAAAALWDLCGLTRPWNDPAADIALALATPQATIFADRHDSELVGTVMMGVDGHRGWIYYLAVAPTRRGQGLARQLMGEAEAWIAAQGVTRVNLMVRADNAAVVGFYAHLGYRRSDVTVLQRDLG